ncbi:hypothetical protein NUM_49490 [Actinocatenispora comari]|uniref:Uncharacterized protein n=1 Tax=Actinocatenispora comari TaxID=2807577 RepID=A0A8J4EMY0_9ACTN|nr:hypothetical protein NUM_49490 [Actinocatenispora comari]
MAVDGVTLGAGSGPVRPAAEPEPTPYPGGSRAGRVPLRRDIPDIGTNLRGPAVTGTAGAPYGVIAAG